MGLGGERSHLVLELVDDVDVDDGVVAVVVVGAVGVGVAGVVGVVVVVVVVGVGVVVGAVVVVVVVGIGAVVAVANVSRDPSLLFLFCLGIPKKIDQVKKAIKSQKNRQEEQPTRIKKSGKTRFFFERQGQSQKWGPFSRLGENRSLFHFIQRKDPFRNLFIKE